MLWEMYAFMNAVFILQQSRRQLHFAKGVEKTNIFYLVEDFAEIKMLSLSKLVGDENSGRIHVALVDAESHKDLDTASFVYRIKRCKR